MAASPGTKKFTARSLARSASRILMPYRLRSPMASAVILSLDAASGSVRWKGTRGESRVGHVTPIRVGGETQFVSAAGDRVQGFDARTGKRICSIYIQVEG